MGTIDKFVKYAGLSLIGVLVLWFAIWNFGVPIDRMQVIVIFVFLAIIGVVILVLNVMSNKNRFTKTESRFLKAKQNCINMWNELTRGGERLMSTEFDSLPKIFTNPHDPNNTMTVQAFVFIVNNYAKDKVLLYYCYELEDIIGRIRNPSATKELNPFDDFDPFSRQPMTGSYKKGGIHMYFGSKSQKEKYELERENYKDKEQPQGEE